MLRDWRPTLKAHAFRARGKTNRLTACNATGVQDGFDAAFMGFWWSHVRRESIGQFLDALTRHLTAGAKVIAIDNRFVKGSSTAISRTDDQGNSFQARTLQDGTTWEV